MSISLPNKEQNGSVIVSILVVTLFLTTVISALIVLAGANLTRARNRIMLLQAQYSAESGADSAIAILNSGNETYTGTSSELQILRNNLYKSTFTVSVAAGSGEKEKIITATGKVYAPANAPAASFTKTVEVIAQRSSSSAAPSLLSRNIIYIQSGVKNIEAKDVLLNGFIMMAKNTTTFIAENITVSGQSTFLGKICSILGAGKLDKPASFSTPGQTKTKLTLGYNNCISPPGNNSNEKFDVFANQPNVPTIQSTFIPWSQYMDNSYQNSANNCADWTTGSFPRHIPSTGNTKKTHYPDSGNGISSSCGSGGDLYLQTGQYNIEDHVHIRAKLCAATACNPTFYNPDNGPNGIKFVFVEGALNFASINAAAGSGPIVFMVYGTDPLSKIFVCPLGGAVYLGNSGTSSTPNIYFVASNGVCFDKTKFSASPAFGGVSGKNIYIATNPGTPFDLKLDPAFPVNLVPIDLSWLATRYRVL